MALVPVEQYVVNAVTGGLRVAARRIRTKTFAAGSGTIPKAAALARNSSTGFYQAWAAPVSQVETITKAGTVTGGTFTVTIDGQASAAIAYNASNATILAALEAMPNIQPGDVVLSGGGVAGVSTGALTLTFAGNKAGRSMVISTGSGSLTGGGTYDAAIVTAGVESVSVGTDKIAGFLWPDDLLLQAGGEVIGQVLFDGTIHRDDIPLNGVTQNALDAALKDIELRKLGIVVEGLAGVA